MKTYQSISGIVNAFGNYINKRLYFLKNKNLQRKKKNYLNHSKLKSFLTNFVSQFKEKKKDNIHIAKI